MPDGVDGTTPTGAPTTMFRRRVPHFRSGIVDSPVGPLAGEFPTWRVGAFVSCVSVRVDRSVWTDPCGPIRADRSVWTGPYSDRSVWTGPYCAGPVAIGSIIQMDKVGPWVQTAETLGWKLKLGGTRRPRRLKYKFLHRQLRRQMHRSRLPLTRRGQRVCLARGEARGPLDSQAPLRRYHVRRGRSGIQRDVYWGSPRGCRGQFRCLPPHHRQKRPMRARLRLSNAIGASTMGRLKG